MTENSIAKLEDVKSGSFGADALVSLEDLSIEDIPTETTESAGGTPFIAYDHREGTYSVGKEAVQLPENQRVLLDPLSARKGFMAFIKGQKLPEKRMAPFFSRQAVTTSDLPAVDSKFGWRPAGSVPGVLLGGPCTGKRVALEGSGQHFIQAFNDVFAKNSPTNQLCVASALIKEQRKPVEERKVYPVVELSVREYDHPDYGKQKAQKFVIVAYVTQEEAQALAEEAVESAAEDVLSQSTEDTAFTEAELVDALPETDETGPEEPIRRKPRRR